MASSPVSAVPRRAESAVEQDERWVLELFHRSAQRVPAYRRFLAQHGVDHRAIQSLAQFQGVPVMTKETYIRRSPLAEVLCDGTREDAWVVSTSSGSTGEQCYWARGPVNQAAAARILGALFEDLGSTRRSTLSLIAFGMGSWLGGTYHLQAMLDLRERGHRITTITPGSDVEACVRALDELAPHFEQTVIQGYPPLIKDILDHAVQAGVDLPARNVRLVPAGELISEGWRDAVAKLTGADPVEHVRCIYGSSDTGAIGVETRGTVELRRLATDSERLWSELFGDATVAPTLVEYDPLLRHVTARDGMLLFTLDGAVPLVRYRLGDTGDVHSAAELRAKAARALGRRPPHLPGRPCIVVGPRVDIAGSFYGGNIYPENIKAGLEHPALRADVTGKFILHVDEDPVSKRPVLNLDIECTGPPDGKRGLAHRIQRLVVDALTTTNAEYRYLHSQLGTSAEPNIRLVEPNRPEFVIDTKHRWVHHRGESSA